MVKSFVTSTVFTFLLFLSMWPEISWNDDQDVQDRKRIN